MTDSAIANPHSMIDDTNDIIITPISYNFKYLRIFVFELQQNKKIVNLRVNIKLNKN